VEGWICSEEFNGENFSWWKLQMLQAKETQEIVTGEKERMLVIGLHGTRRRIEMLSCCCPMYFTVY
jgi:iron only hydrogenase large subunit-like protein